MSDPSEGMAAFAKRHWFAIAFVIVAAVWEFGLNLALQKGFFDAWSNGQCFSLLAGPIIAGIALGLAHPETRARYYLLKVYKKMSLAMFLVGGAIVGGVLWFLFSITHPALALVTKISSSEFAGSSEFSASILTFEYREVSQELFAKVSFDNLGPKRRTILGGHFFSRASNDKDSVHWFSKEDREAIYVEPNQPIVVQFREKVPDVSPQTPDTAFGLDISTIRNDGRENSTQIEAMVIGFDKTRITALSGDQANVDLGGKGVGSCLNI